VKPEPLCANSLPITICLSSYSVIGAAFVIAFIFEAGPAVVFAVLVMGCIAAVMESIAGGNKSHDPQRNCISRSKPHISSPVVNTKSRCLRPIGPFSCADGHYLPGISMSLFQAKQQ